MIIIPARLASTRFPNKILCDIGGMPMFVRSAINASQVDEVVLALDSKETCDIAARFGLKAVLTDPSIPNGSLRVLEASRMLGLQEHEPLINLQADEPFLESSVIQALKDSLEKADFMATCAKRIDWEAAKDPSVVKVVLNHKSEALYFSRAPIPHKRDGAAQDSDFFLGHIGIYGYFRSSLEFLAARAPAPLEELEKLEQLRALHYKKPIAVSIVESQSIGIDTPEDLAKIKL